VHLRSKSERTKSSHNDAVITTSQFSEKLPVMVTSALPLLLRPGNLLIFDKGFFLALAVLAS
jgi:hypothetical protein